jgi:cholesterol transport system auxiliary component
MKNIARRSKKSLLGALLSAAWLLSGCSMLLPANSPPPTLFSFDSPETVMQMKPTAPLKNGAPTLIVSIPRAAPGFDSYQIVYIRRAHTFEYFRQSQWVDTPANMLAPLVVAALEGSGGFSAVIQSPTSVAGQLRLDLEIVRLQNEFFMLPSQAHFTLRAHLVDTSSRQVAAWREFDAMVPASSEDPYGSVLAANNAVRNVIKELVLFCRQTAGNYLELQP